MITFIDNDYSAHNVSICLSVCLFQNLWTDFQGISGRYTVDETTVD